MRRNSRRVSSFVLGCALLWALAGAPARAAAWTQGDGQGEMIVTSLFDQANTSFNQAGRFTPTAQYRSLQAYAYVEYGVSDWLTALVKPSLQSSSLGAPLDQHFTGLGDSELGFRARLWRNDDTVLSVQAEARIPTSAGAANSWLPGSKNADFDLRGLLGKTISVGGFSGFINLELAYRLRGGAAPNEARADVSFGLYATPNLLVLAQSFNIVSEASQNPNFPHWTQSKAQLSLVYRVAPEWRVQAGGFTTLAGLNAYRENGVLLAVWRQF